MGKRTLLTDSEAKAIGITKFNKPQPHSNKARYMLNDEQLSKLDEIQGQVLEDKTENKTKPNDYNKKASNPFVLSAFNKEKGSMMDINEYCEYYKLPRKDISSYKLVSHTGTPFYNIVFKENIDEGGLDWGNVRKILDKEINSVYTYKNKTFYRKSEGVLKWADLHFGSYIRNLLLVDDFDKDILKDWLSSSVAELNSMGFKKNHIHIHGDLIESFSGLNHINSWQSMEADMVGSKAIRMCSKMLHEVLSQVDNLGKVIIVAGNHDRLSKANDEEVKGGAADLIAYALELMGYDVEFHPYVYAHQVDGINYIVLHGDKGISKRSSSDIILDYGVQGMYNLICEGHLHSIIEKLSIKQRESFKIQREDSIMHRRFYIPSFFTGNYYSATLGYTTNSGYVICWDNGKGRPQVTFASN